MRLFVFTADGEAIDWNGYHHHHKSYIGELLTAADRCKKGTKKPYTPNSHLYTVVQIGHKVEATRLTNTVSIIT